MAGTTSRWVLGRVQVGGGRGRLGALETRWWVLSAAGLHAGLNLMDAPCLLPCPSSLPQINFVKLADSADTKLSAVPNMVGAPCQPPPIQTEAHGSAARQPSLPPKPSLLIPPFLPPLGPCPSIPPPPTVEPHLHPGHLRHRLLPGPGHRLHLLLRLLRLPDNRRRRPARALPLRGRALRPAPRRRRRAGGCWVLSAWLGT